MLKTLLFTGRNIAYNPDETSIDMAQMFGFIKNQNGNVVIANRIFETRYIIIILQKQRCSRQRYIRQPCRTRVSL